LVPAAVTFLHLHRLCPELALIRSQVVGCQTRGPRTE